MALFKYRPIKRTIDMTLHIFRNGLNNWANSGTSLG